MSDTSTGKVVVNRSMSLDGFIAGPGHTMDWGPGRIADFVAPDDITEVAAATGAMLVGRRTWEVGAKMEADEPGSADYPFSGPMFVLTHEPPEPPDPEVTYLTGDIGKRSPRRWTFRAARTLRSSAPTWPANACGGGSSTRSSCMYCSATASASRPQGWGG